MSRQRIELSVLLRQESGLWVAQCLEYDLAAQGATLSEAKEAFAHLFMAQIAMDLSRGKVPLEDVPQPPSYYRSEFQAAERLADPQELPSPTKNPVIEAKVREFRIAA